MKARMIGSFGEDKEAKERIDRKRVSREAPRIDEVTSGESTGAYCRSIHSKGIGLSARWECGEGGL
jgi:hypothetical protein